MKLLLCVTLTVIIAGIVAATPTSQTASIPNPEPDNSEQEPFQTFQLGSDFHRYRKSYGSGGGGASIPSPPCPKNYLFSCRPNLSLVPCASGDGGSGGYGSSGAYTAPVPAYVNPIGYTFNGPLPKSYQKN